MPKPPTKKNIYDREKTKQKLIAAVGKILVKEGYHKIKINKIETVAGVSKKLIYRYFGDLNGLIKTYLEQKDFWNIELQKNKKIPKTPPQPLEIDELFSVLKSNFDFFERSTEMQKILLWGISEKNKTHKELAMNRELYGQPLLEQLDLTFKNSDIDIRAVLGIFVSSVYYAVTHAKTLSTPI